MCMRMRMSEIGREGGREKGREGRREGGRDKGGGGGGNGSESKRECVWMRMDKCAWSMTVSFDSR